MAFAEIRKLLATQAEAMLRFGEVVEELQSAILDRDWPAIERLVPGMERSSAELAEMDARRHELFTRVKAEVGLGDDAGLAELIGRADPGERHELATLYRSLQASVLWVKSMTRGIDSYLRGTLRTTHEVLGEVFPDQKGTIYSRRGRRSPADGRAMVLDRHL